MDHLVRTMTGKTIVNLPCDGDAEGVVPPDQQLLVCASRHDEGDLAVGLQKGTCTRRYVFCFSFGGRAASLVAVSIILAVAVVFSVVAARKRGVSRNEPISSDISSLAENSSLGAAVCILGQLSRLEIESKMQNIIEPLANFTTVKVFLSLETGDHGVFNNRITADKEDVRCPSSLLDVDGVKAAFAPYFKDGVFAPHVDENVTLERWPKLYKWKHPGNNAHDIAQRRIHIANVASQLRHQKVCSELIQQSEVSTGGKYDIVVKVRDNTIAMRPVAPDKLLSITEVVLKDCSKWGGVNDKVMALPRKHLEKSLGATYPSMIAVMNDDPLDHKLRSMSDQSANTEQVVMHTLVGNAVPFRELTFEKGDRDGDNYLPFVDGRCYAGKEPGSENRWCIVSHCKDCWPSAPWTYDATCEIAVTGQEVPPPGGTVANRENASFEQTLAVPDPERECLKPIYR